ncbi:hypothetical protein [Rarobacter incanus]|uniref:Uncharacterized protein n=1 Tax=Rarobacter incanus TaxID=153494 RepID=A0A542SLM3_9MICO|nr:hypothetical protein [Rarobacter incanus]TQK75385.1 hypothetical protein FB389_0009 [Rarobacter incanus]
MAPLDPWVSNRMGGTGSHEPEEYKVRDSRKQLPGGQNGPRGLSHRDRRAIRADIRAAKRTGRVSRPGRGDGGHDGKQGRFDWFQFLRVFIAACLAASTLLWVAMIVR